MLCSEYALLKRLAIDLACGEASERLVTELVIKVLYAGTSTSMKCLLLNRTLRFPCV